MAGISVHVSHLSHLPETFFVQFYRKDDCCCYTFPLSRDVAEKLMGELGSTLSGRFEEPTRC
jgi:hypothetical protein